MPDVTDHPEYDPADFERDMLCCHGTGLIEVRGEVEQCPFCQAIIEKYRDYLPKQEGKPDKDGIPF